MNTYLPGITATAKLLNLQSDYVAVTTVADEDSIELRIYTRTSEQVGSTCTYATGDIVQTGSDFKAYVTMPTLPGSYYLQWDIVLNSRVGKFTQEFQIRPRV